MDFRNEEYDYEKNCGCDCGHGYDGGYDNGYDNGYESNYHEGYDEGYNQKSSKNYGDDVFPAYSYTYRVPACKEYKKTVFMKKCKKVYTYYKPAGSCITPGRCYEINKCNGGKNYYHKDSWNCYHNGGGNNCC